MRATALERDALVADIDCLFTRETSDEVSQLIFTDAGEQLVDEVLAGGQVGDVDRRNELMHGPANFFARELARAVIPVIVHVDFSAVDGVEVGIERDDALAGNFVLRAEAANDEKNSHAKQRGGKEISKHGIFLSLGQRLLIVVKWPSSVICCRDSAVERCGKAHNSISRNE